MVLFFHFPLTEPPWLSVLVPKSVHLGLVGIFCFFLISGFVIPVSLRKHPTVWSFLVSRFFRLFPLYWVILIVFFFLARNGLIHGVVRQDLTFMHCLVYAFLLNGYFHLPVLMEVAWTLVVEIQFYFLVALSRLFPMKFHPLLLTGFILLVATFSITGIFWHTPLPGVISALLLAAFSGQILQMAWSRRMPWEKALSVVVLIVVISLIGLASREAVKPYQYGFQMVALSLACGYALFAFFMIFSQWKFGFLVAYGEVSYSAYLTHLLVIRFLIAPWSTQWYALILAVLITWGVSLLTCRWIEQPGQRLGRIIVKRLAEC